MFRSHGRRAVAFLAFSASSLLGPVGLFAQAETGRIAGRAVDQTGAVLPGVTITVTNLVTSQARTTVTNQEGGYQFAALQPSRYSLAAELQGFTTVVRQEVTVNIGSLLDVNFEMAVSGVHETVTVTSEAPLVQSAKTELSHVITTQQLEALPVKSRKYLDLVLLLPATVENVSTDQLGAGLNLGGARSKETALLVDGFYNMDEGFAQPRQRHSQDAIQEFQVVSFGASAEHGRAIGGIVNAITKAGGNRFSGSGYGYFRGKALNAQDPAQRRRGVPKSEFERQQWGGTLGGPIQRDRSFFFGAYERVSEDLPFDNRISPENGALIGLPPKDVGTITAFYRLNFAMGKWDHNISSNQRLQASFAMSRPTEFALRSSPFASRSRQQLMTSTDLSYMLKWTGISSGGRLLHELKGSYFPRYWKNTGPSEGGPPIAADGQINLNARNSSPPTVIIPSVASFGWAPFTSEIDTHATQLIYSMSRFTDRHSVKFGADYMVTLYDLDFLSQVVGVYTFSSLANFLAGRYATFTQGFGDTKNPRWHQYVSGFVQDSWTMTDRLTTNYGLRYDFELHPKHPGTGTRLGKDYTGLGPRFALSYDLTNQGTTFLKIASGIHVDRLYQRTSTPYPNVKGYEQVQFATWRPQDPGAPTYPAVFAERPRSLPGSLIDAWILPSELRTPRTGQVVGTVERALTPDLSVSMSAVYTRSRNKEYTWDANLEFDRSQQRWIRPDPNYRIIRQYRFDGKAEYVGGIFEITKRGGRVGFTANATIARAYDSVDHGDNFLRDQRLGIDGDWGPAVDTPRIRGVVSGWYNLTPTTQVSGVFTARGGMALTAMAPGFDVDGDGRIGDPTPALGRNAFRGPGTNSLDLRLTWAPSLKGTRLYFYVEGFNALNQENVRTVNNDYGPDPANPKPIWMTPVTYFPPREVQFGVRLAF